jgi:hypothetical protein
MPVDAHSPRAGSSTGQAGSIAPGGQADASERFALLVACARTEPDRTGIRSILARGPECWPWQQFVTEARMHGVLPLVARALRAHAQDLVPAEPLAALADLYRKNAVRNALLLRRLAEVVERLEGAGVESIPVKGPTLAVQAYGALAFRQFADLDILVRHEHMPRVAEVLDRAGFRHLGTDHFGQYANFGAEDGTVTLDVQWGLAPRWFPFPVDLAGLWSRATRVDVAGHDLRQPTDEDLLLYLCAHAAKHCWSKLGWVADLNELVTRHRASIDWHELFERAREEGARRGLLIGLSLLRDVMNARLPAKVEQQMTQDRRIAAISAVIQTKLAVGGERLLAHTGAFGAAERWRFQWLSRERWRDRLRYLGHLVSAPVRRRRWLRGLAFRPQRALGEGRA